MFRILLVWAYMLIPAACFAAPTVVEARVGQMVEFTAPEGIKYDWKTIPETENFKVYEQGKKAVFSSEISGEYLVICGYTKGDGHVEVLVYRIVADNRAAPLSLKVSNWCKSVASPSVKQDAMKLAESFRSVADLTEKGELADAEAVVVATADSNRAALGEQIINWKPFLEAMQKELIVMAESGTLPDAKSHVPIWDEIADALERFATS